MLTNLQALRALAAIAVVVFHFGLMPPTSLSFTIGAAGVDLFFVLSGFIIAYSASRDARHFLARRVIRIVPAYWIATIIAALFTLEHLNWRDAAGWLVQSLFYLPGPAGRPVLIFVAWTLVYELFFYLLYWLALRTGANRASLLAMALLPVIALVPLPGLPGPWPLFLEFAIGIGIYLITERLGLVGRNWGSAGVLIAAGALLLMPVLPELTGYSPDDHRNLWRVLTWGLPAGCIVLGTVIAERGGLAVGSRAILILGAASYAIYLLHPIAVGQLLQLPPHSPPASWAILIGATVAIVALSFAFHLWVEAPMLRKLRRLIGDQAPIEQRALERGDDVQIR
jgi:exopolysaccharide production protein ExoZ